MQRALNPFIEKEHQNKVSGNRGFHEHSIDDIIKTLTLGCRDYTNKASVKKQKHYQRAKVALKAFKVWDRYGKTLQTRKRLVH